MSRKLDFCFATLVLLFGFKSVVLCAAEEGVSEILTKNLLARLNGGTTRHYCPATTSSDESWTEGRVYASNGKHQNGEGAGEQPNVKDCAGESWAKCEADNTDSDVTKWYFDMFFKPIQDQRIKALADAEISKPASHDTIDTAHPIISFNLNMTLTSDDIDAERLPKCKEVDDLREIRQSFRQLFSTEEGRKLAWRTLIEVYRVGGDVEDCIPMYIKDPQYDKYNNKRLVIYLSDTPSFGYFKDTINLCSRLSLSTRPKYDMQVILPKLIAKKAVKIGQSSQQKVLSQTIFHECLHWFHSLRNPSRFSRDSGCSNPFLSDTSVSHFFYGGLAGGLENQKRSLSPWDKANKEDLLNRQYCHEEHLTICGAPESQIDSEKFFFGDELSENKLAYELHKEQTEQGDLSAIRAGHAHFQYYEDIRVVKRILTTISQQFDVAMIDYLYDNEYNSTGDGYTEKGLGWSLFKKVDSRFRSTVVLGSDKKSTGHRNSLGNEDE